MQFEIDEAEMTAMVIKTVGLFLVTYYTNFKIMNRQITFNFKTNMIIIITGIISGIMKYTINSIISTVILIIIISALFSDDNITYSILATIISLSINYAIELTVIIICFGINKIILVHNDYLELLIISSLHILLLYSIFKIKKFRYGISFLQKNINNEYKDIIILNISIMILFLAMRVSIAKDEITSIISMEIIIYAIIMYITIKKSLQLYYKQKLLVQDLNETKKELEEKKEEIKELENENLSFKKKSHSLIHQQKSLEYKIQEMLMQTEVSKEEVGEIKSKL